MRKRRRNANRVNWAAKGYRRKGDWWIKDFIKPLKSLYRRYDRRSFRTIRIKSPAFPGGLLLIACPKGSWRPRIERCKKGMHRISIKFPARSRQRNMARNGKRKKMRVIKPKTHREYIAWKTLRMPDPIAGVMGGMSKAEARKFLKSLGYKLTENPTFKGTRRARRRRR